MRTRQSEGKKDPAKDIATRVKPGSPATPARSAPAAKRARSPAAPKAKGGGRLRPVPAASTLVEVGTLVIERERMVAEAAYYRAERRGFAPGYELEDWLEAEAEVERRLGR